MGSNFFPKVPVGDIFFQTRPPTWGTLAKFLATLTLEQIFSNLNRPSTRVGPFTPKMVEKRQKIFKSNFRDPQKFSSQNFSHPDNFFPGEGGFRVPSPQKPRADPGRRAKFSTKVTQLDFFEFSTLGDFGEKVPLHNL